MSPVFEMLFVVFLTFTSGLGYQHSETNEFGIVHVYPASAEREPEPNCTSDTDIIDKLLNGTGYNKFKLPQPNGIEVAVEFWVQAITSIDEITNDFELDLYINEVWTDPALAFEHLSPCKQNLSLNHQVLDKLWTPNSCFINSKIAEIHSSPFKNVFLLLYRNGSVWVNYRVRAKGPCAMNLANFPFDTQTCNLIYESFNYNNQEVQMRWNPLNNNPVYAVGQILLPDFEMVKIVAELQIVPYPAGMWDELHCKFTFKRRLAYYFLQAYMPVYLTIFISWISFSLGSRAIPARTMLGVNALLAIIFQFGNIMRNLPKVSYVKAIDVWMLGGMTFIFLSLLELAVIGHMVKDEGNVKKRPPVLCSQKRSLPFQLTESPPRSPKGIYNYEKRFMFPVHVQKCQLAWSKQPHFFWPQCFLSRTLTPNDIDSFCSIAFPASFALFNIAYYSFYLMRSAARAADH